MANIIFITGTDTGVGKTVVTGLMLRHLRDAGYDAWAAKPFCSGSRADAKLLRLLQDNLLTMEEINPFFFEKPLAPAAAAKGRKMASVDLVLAKIRTLARRCDVLLVEGVGGFLVPLGKNYTVADLVARLGCPVILVSRNRLGTINHTLLTVKAMQDIGIKLFKMVMIESKKPDISSKTNAKMIAKMAGIKGVISIPNLNFRAGKAKVIKINAKYLKKSLALLLGDGIFAPSSVKPGEKVVQQNPLTPGCRRRKLAAT